MREKGRKIEENKEIRWTEKNRRGRESGRRKEKYTKIETEIDWFSNKEREIQRGPELAEIFILSKEITVFNHKQSLIAGRLCYNNLSIISSFRNQCFNDISGNFGWNYADQLL